MAAQAELAFVKAYATALSAQPVVYGDDYQAPPESELKRVPVLPVSVSFAPRHAGSYADGGVLYGEV